MIMDSNPVRGRALLSARNVPLGIVLCTILVVVGLHVVWLVADDSPMSHFDSYLYLANSVAFNHEVPTIRSLCGLDQSFSTLSVHGRPPLYQLAAAPFIWLADGAQDSAIVVNLIALAVLAFVVFRLGLGIAGPFAACLAAFLSITYPPVSALAHEFRPHAVFGAMVAICAWQCTRLVARVSVARMWGSFLLVTASALIHPALFAVVVVPTSLSILVAVWRHFRNPSGDASASRLKAAVTDPLVKKAIVPAGLASMTVVALWYLLKGKMILAKYFVWKGTDIADFRGRKYVVQGFQDDAGPFWYLTTAPAALSIPLVALFVAGLLYALLKDRRGMGWILLVLAWVVVVIGFGDTAFTWWKMSAALPMVALLSARVVDAVPIVRLRATLMLVVAAVAAFNLSFVLFGSGGWGDGVARALGSRVDSVTCERSARHFAALCAQSPKTIVWPSEEIVAGIRNAMEKTVTRGPRNEVMIVSGDLIPNAMVSYWLNLHWPRNALRTRGVGFQNWGGAYNLGSLLEAKFILYPIRPIRARVEGYIPTTLRLLYDPPPLFDRTHKEVGTFRIPEDPRFPGVEKLRLIRRSGVLTAAEARQVIDAVDLPEKFMGQAKGVLERAIRRDRRLGGENRR